jgi:hypothetical protein
LIAKRKAERDKELEEYNKSNAGAHLDSARNSFYAQMIKMDRALMPTKKKETFDPLAMTKAANPESTGAKAAKADDKFDLDKI